MVQPATHQGNSLKNWFTKYTTHGANQTKLRTSIVPWSQIHGTGQSKPRTFIVIYVNFLNYQRNAYSSSRHTTQAYNRQQTTIQHMLTHTAYCHTESYHSTAHSYTASKPRTFIVIYVNFLNYQPNAYSSSSNIDAAAQFRNAGNLGVNSVRYYSELNTVPNW